MVPIGHIKFNLSCRVGLEGIQNLYYLLAYVDVVPGAHNIRKLLPSHPYIRLDTYLQTRWCFWYIVVKSFLSASP